MYEQQILELLAEYFSLSPSKETQLRSLVNRLPCNHQPIEMKFILRCVIEEFLI